MAQDQAKSGGHKVTERRTGERRIFQLLRTPETTQIWAKVCCDAIIAAKIKSVAVYYKQVDGKNLFTVDVYCDGESAINEFKLALSSNALVTSYRELFFRRMDDLG